MPRGYEGGGGRRGGRGLRCDDGGMTGTHEAKIEHGNRRSSRRSNAVFEDISAGWGPQRADTPGALPAARFAADRRAALSREFPGERIVIEAGPMKQRSNDTFYPYRPHSAFAHLTGWGSDSEPGAVLVLAPVEGGHDATVYFRERAGPDSEALFANPQTGRSAARRG